MAIRREGHGPPLLFIHDWNTSSIPFQRTNLPHLRQHFQVLTFDLPGYGSSEEKKDLDVPTLTRLVIALADHAGWERFHLLGFCLGGILAMDTALRYPHRIHKQVLLEPLFHFPLMLNPVLWTGLGRTLLDFFSHHRNGQRWFLGFMTPQPRRAAFHLSRSFHGSRGGTSLHYLRLLKAYGKINHWDRIAQCETPTLVITGAQTWRKIKDDCSRLMKVCPGASRLVIPKAGHFLLSECPGKIQEAVAQFLLELSPGTKAPGDGLPVGVFQVSSHRKALG